jgi:hypothetical protein
MIPQAPVPATIVVVENMMRDAGPFRVADRAASDGSDRAADQRARRRAHHGVPDSMLSHRRRREGQNRSEARSGENLPNHQQLPMPII